MEEDLKQRVRDRYAGVARSVLGEAEDGGSCSGDGASCCGVAETGERAALDFEEVAVEVTHTHPPEQIAGLSGEDAEALRKVPAASAFIRASKPEAL